MKLAYFSPLNPQPSGISDYSEELLPYLLAQAEIDLFVDGFQPANPELLALKCIDYQKDPTTLDQLSEYDAVIYHVGNDQRYHSGIFKVMRRHPGIAVFHEYVLQDYFLGQAYDLKDMSLYLAELEACHGPRERARAEEAIRQGGLPPQAAAPIDYPLNCRLARSAEAIIAHSEWSRSRLQRVAPEVPVTQISMPVKLLSPTLRDAWARRNPLRRFVSIASFGVIIPRKGIEQVLQALSGLKQEFDFHYTLVGAENPYYDVRELIIRHGMTEHVTITGHVSLEEFDRYIAATDIAVNLREYTVGETSASLCRIMGVGATAVVSDIGWFSEIPDDCVVKVMPDENFVSTLQSSLRQLMDDGSLRSLIGENARKFVRSEHNIWRAAERYLAFIREVIARRPPKAQRGAPTLTVSQAKPSDMTQESIDSSPMPPLTRTTAEPSSTQLGSHVRAAQTDPVGQLKLAYFSPLNPLPSGISDYSEELLQHLRQHARLDLFVDGFRPNNPQVTVGFQLFDYRQDPSVLDALDQYDAAIYHIGNDHRYHSGILRAMQRRPGILVLHDFALQDFFLGLAREQGLMSIYLDELEACYGKRERARAAEYFRRGALPPHVDAPLDFPLVTRMARSAEGIIVHSEWSRERLSALAPGVPVARIKHHITARAAAAPAAIRERGKDARVMIASFGLVTPDKAIDRTLRALAALRDECEFHYTLVGSTGNFLELDELIRRYGLEDRVSMTGYVALEEFERRIAETDIAITLRERPVGATSGSLCRIMAAGVPAIVSNVGAFAELPNDAVVKVDHDQHGDALLQAYLRRLIDDQALREGIGRNARRYVLREHQIETSAAAYVDFIRQVIARRPRTQFLNNLAAEVSQLGIRETDVAMRGIASEIAVLGPFTGSALEVSTATETSENPTPAQPVISGNGHPAPAPAAETTPGRLARVDGIDYRRGALEYSGLLTEKLSYYLRTKPFCNLHKPVRFKADGMDPETHRHFNDFANMAVALALPANARILDVGCGPGWLSEYFARLGYDVTGIDISDDLIQIARERLARVPYQVDHETPLRCRFLTHDIEVQPLAEKFDAVICYDSLHHLEDEEKAFTHLAAMLDIGGLLFVLEGRMPSAGSATEEALREFMREYKTLESPFSDEYLHALLDQHGFAIVGNYVSINGLFEREMLTGDVDDLRLPLRKLDTDYHYLTCMKVAQDAPATSVPDSRAPGVLRAELRLRGGCLLSVRPGAQIDVPITVQNTGDTVWLTGQTVRAGVVMPGVRVFDEQGIVSEFHGHPLLPRSVAPGQTMALTIQFAAPSAPGTYAVKIDLVDQCVCWFEEKGSEPLVLSLEVEDKR